MKWLQTLPQSSSPRPYAVFHDFPPSLIAFVVDALSAAVKSTGAKRAFMYLAHGTPDHMNATLEALRSAGIEFVTFLSSYTVHGELQEIPPADVIPYVHAQVEINLAKIFGQENFVAVRPGAFATNIIRYKEGINAGKVPFFGSDFEMDGITPVDMGEVSGTILAKGPHDGQRVVYLYGPQLMKQGEAAQKVAEVLGKTAEVCEIDAASALEHHTKAGIPGPVAEYIVRTIAQAREGKVRQRQNYEEGVRNIESYLQRPALGFEEWVVQNRNLFTT